MLPSRTPGPASCSGRPHLGWTSRLAVPRRRPTAATPEADDRGPAPDLVTSLFGRLFGARALDDPTPGGLKRLEGTALAAQYPATTTAWADAVETDSPGAAAIRPLLKNTPLERAPLVAAYDAVRDGWGVEAFFAGVATRGANVIVATTAGGAVCGGYAPRSWLGLGEEKAAASAFLFRFDPARPGDGVAAAKLPKVGGPGLALIDRPGEGPRFGAEDFRIVFGEGCAEARSRLGTGYAKLPRSGGRSLFAEGEGGRAVLTGLVTYVAEGDPETWELDGVVWKSK